MASGKLIGFIAAITVAACGSAAAQQGTYQQREACTPDAFRLCMSAMPDAGRVEGCLRSNGPRLSAACAAVFEPQQTEETTRSIRDRRAPRDVEQRDVRQRDRDYYGQRYDRRDDRREYRDPDDQYRRPRDGFGGPRDDDD